MLKKRVKKVTIFKQYRFKMNTTTGELLPKDRADYILLQALANDQWSDVVAEGTRFFLQEQDQADAAVVRMGLPAF